ncbi:hypothetical protein FHX08_006309 [Rhizobium sp. BK529]|uniref:hypothetical protein n=1 Tax=Rhizobium sp. BK529 TaxID=2586983 RepID=UPI00160CAB3D|nr:hypothetical protein [Rhizobium sp. BK529]MBB3595889.1 hypothetical protein [Rhizobium sp. BK529]
MRQTKPFIVEIKQTRKSKAIAQKPSIWGNLDLNQYRDLVTMAPAKDVEASSKATRD